MGVSSNYIMWGDLVIQCTHGTGLGQDMSLEGHLLPPLAACLLCCDLHHSAEWFRLFSSARLSSCYGNLKKQSRSISVALRPSTFHQRNKWRWWRWQKRWYYSNNKTITKASIYTFSENYASILSINGDNTGSILLAIKGDKSTKLHVRRTQDCQNNIKTQSSTAFRAHELVIRMRENCVGFATEEA